MRTWCSFRRAATTASASRTGTVLPRGRLQRTSRWLFPRLNTPQILTVSNNSTIPKLVMPKQYFYAVRKGRITGIFTEWTKCEEQVKNFSGPEFKKFSSRAEAEAFLKAQPAALNSTSAFKPPEDGPRGRKRALPSFSDETESIVVYTDGACKGNGQVGSVAGIGIYWGPNDPRNIAERCPGHQTNNRAELIAIIRALETTPVNKKLLIKTDSQYAIKCFRDWLPKWQDNGFQSISGQPVKNVEIIKYLSALIEQRGTRGQKVELQYVKGHSGDPGNDGADAHANLGATFSSRHDPDWIALESRASETIGALVPSLEPYGIVNAPSGAHIAPGSSESEERPAKIPKNSTLVPTEVLPAVPEARNTIVQPQIPSAPPKPPPVRPPRSHLRPNAIGSTNLNKPTIYERPANRVTLTPNPASVPINPLSPTLPTVPLFDMPLGESVNTVAAGSSQKGTLPDRPTTPPPNTHNSKPLRSPRSPLRVSKVGPPLVPVPASDIDFDHYKDCLLEGDEWKKEIENL